MPSKTMGKFVGENRKGLHGFAVADWVGWDFQRKRKARLRMREAYEERKSDSNTTKCLTETQIMRPLLEFHQEARLYY